MEKSALFQKSFVPRILGFTIIEVLVVLAVVGILTTIVVGGFRKTQRRGREAQRKNDLKQLSESQIADLYVDPEPTISLSPKEEVP